MCLRFRSPSAMEHGSCGTSSFHRFEIGQLKDDLQQKTQEIAQLKEGIRRANLELKDDIAQLKEGIRKELEARASMKSFS